MSHPQGPQPPYNPNQPSPPSGWQPPPYQTPRSNNHKTRNIILGIVGGLVGIGVLASLAPPSKETGAAPTGTPTPVMTVSVPVIPTAPATVPVVSATAPPTQPNPATATMPNMVGLNAAVAGDKLLKLGLRNVQYGTTTGKLVVYAANWQVTKQSTKAGSKVSSDTLIVLTCKRVSG